MVTLIQQRSQPAVAAQLPVLLAAAVVLAVVLGSGSGDEADSQPQGLTFLFWLSHTLTGLLLMSAITRLLAGRLPASAPPWQQLLLGGTLGALCFAPLALLIEHGFATLGFGESDTQHFRGEFQPLLWLGEVLGEFGNMAPPFVLSWLLLNLSYQSLRPPVPAPVTVPVSVPVSGTATEAEAEPKAAQAPTPDQTLSTPTEPNGLLAQLPPALGQEVLLISADLNYVHVVTARGKVMVLYSLTRAASELGELGLQVHRSHWVSKTAVAAVRRNSRGLQIELLDGTQIPVSRRRERLVREEFGADFRRSSGSQGRPLHSGS